MGSVICMSRHVTCALPPCKGREALIFVESKASFLLVFSSDSKSVPVHVKKEVQTAPEV